MPRRDGIGMLRTAHSDQFRISAGTPEISSTGLSRSTRWRSPADIVEPNRKEFLQHQVSSRRQTFPHYTIGKDQFHPHFPKVYISKTHQRIFMGKTGAAVGSYDTEGRWSSLGTQPKTGYRTSPVHKFPKQDRFGMTKRFQVADTGPGPGSYTLD